MKFSFFVQNVRIIGTFFLLLFITLFVACNPNDIVKNKGELKTKNNIVNDEIDSNEIESDNLIFDQPIAFASTNNIAIPLILLVKPQEKYDSDTYYMNIAVINDGSSEAKMVFNQSQIIESIRTFEKRIDGSVEEYDDNHATSATKTVNSLLFIEQVNCAECDGAHKKLFVYNLKSNVLKQLSPEDFSVSNWHIIKENAKVVMNCIVDANKDGEYTEDEEEVVFVCDFLKANSTPIKMGIDVEKLKKQRTRLLKQFYQPEEVNKDED